MLENRNKINRRPNAFKSLLLVFLMVMSTTLAMMVPSEWEQDEATIDVEYRSMQSSPALQSMDQAGQGDYEGSTVFHSDDVHPSLRDIMWADVGVSSGIISDLAAVEAVMASNNFLVEESNRNDHDKGPIDYDALEAQGFDPRNVSTDRFVISTTVHPWANAAVGAFYLADQHPFDHDNDGVTDEDSDGSGAGRFDEDDRSRQPL